MKYKPYPKYKDSGVEWLGEIPEGWKQIAFRRLVSESNAGEVIDKSYWHEGDEILYTCALEPMKSNFPGFPEQKRTTNQDVLLTRNGTPYVHLPVENAIYSNVVQRAKLINNLHRKFVQYSLQCSASTLVGYGVSIDSLNYELWKSLNIAVPKFPTQRAIAAFLDTETARIDGLIQDYEDLIGLLKEKRQALISRAVTRGLSELVSPDDPEFGEWAKPVKFKDSGVEWIGEIPEGWGTWQLKRELDIVTSGSRGWAEFYSEEGAIFIRIGNLTRDGITLNLEDIQRVEVPDNAEAIRTKVCESDLLVSITADIGSVAIIENLHDAAYISQHLAICRFARTTRILPRWAAYYLKSYSGRIQFDQKAYGGTKIQLSLDDVRELLITIPLMSEQHAIASFLDRETAKIDTLVSESESAIELLKEHRSALITNAVTGKINVEASA